MLKSLVTKVLPRTNKENKMFAVLNLLILVFTISSVIGLRCLTCKGYIPSDCSRAISVTSVQCPEGNSFTPVCLYDAQRGFTFQNRSLVERRCERQYSGTKICDRIRENFNATACRICSTDNCNSDVPPENGSVRRVGRFHRIRSKL